MWSIQTLGRLKPQTDKDFSMTNKQNDKNLDDQEAIRAAENDFSLKLLSL